LSVDVHTFVAPALECVYDESLEAFRSHWRRIEAEHLVITRPTPGVGDWTSSYLRLRSTELFKPDPPGASTAGFPTAKTSHAELEAGILHDNAGGRLRAMDALGTSVQCISPALLLDLDVALGSEISRTIFDAYNRYVSSYCDARPDRLKSVLQLHGHEPYWSVGQLEEMAEHASTAAVTLHLPAKIVPDSPHFTPIWEAIERADLPLLHRPGAGTPWWTPQRMLSYLALSGVLDRYPRLRLVFAGWPAGWLADWCESHTGSLLRYLEEGSVYVAIDAEETREDVLRVIDACGDRCLVWQSHFPFRAESDGATQLAWLPQETRDRILFDNPATCFGLGDRSGVDDRQSLPRTLGSAVSTVDA
jgi:predicted TIM-barrel fold metal-dependent hydrolase